MSYLSRVVYPAGGAASYVVPFPYIDKAHVKVYADGKVYTGAVTWASSTVVTLNPNIAADRSVELRRVTPTTPLVAYAGGPIVSTDLNLDALQALYLIQEATDWLNSTFRFSPGFEIPEMPDLDTWTAGYALVKDGAGGLGYGAVAQLGSLIATAFGQSLIGAVTALSGQNLLFDTDGVVTRTPNVTQSAGGHIRLKPYSTVSAYAKLPATGLRIERVFSDGSTQPLMSVASNPDQTADGLFPNLNLGVGDDGFSLFNGVTPGFTTNNRLRSDRQAFNVTSVVNGAITGVSRSATLVGNYVAGQPLRAYAFDVSNQSASGFACTLTVTGNNVDITAITNGGTGYTAPANIIISVDPPQNPTAEAYDIGPVVQIVRDKNLPNGSFVSSILLGTRALGSTGVDLIAGYLGTQVLNTDPAAPRSRIWLTTAAPFSTNGGQAVGWYHSTSIYPQDLSETNPGWVNAKGYAIQGVSIFDEVNTWNKGLNVTFADAGAGGGPNILAYRNSASPAASDLGGYFQFAFKNAAAAQWDAGGMRAALISPTTAAEQSEIQFLSCQAGVNTSRMFLRAGLFMNGATMGDRGAGTINATAVYDDNVLLTCYPFDAALDGSMSIDKWDAKVPDREFVGSAAVRKPRLRQDTQSVRKIEIVNGQAVERLVEESVTVHDWIEHPMVDASGEPIFDYINEDELDEAGNPVMELQDTVGTDEDGQPYTTKLLRAKVKVVQRQRMHREYLFDDIPAGDPSGEVREHFGARKFAERLGGKHDPLDLRKYIDHWRKKRHLTSLPNEQKFDPTEGLAVGSWLQRLIETVELQAIHDAQLLEMIDGQAQTIATLETRLRALEKK